MIPRVGRIWIITLPRQQLLDGVLMDVMIVNAEPQRVALHERERESERERERATEREHDGYIHTPASIRTSVHAHTHTHICLLVERTAHQKPEETNQKTQNKRACARTRRARIRVRTQGLHACRILYYSMFYVNRQYVCCLPEARSQYYVCYITAYHM